MGVEGVSGSTNATTTGSTNTSLGKDDFLKLLVTQLQNQNPLDPMDPTQMLGQMSQLTQVEKLVTISDTLESMNTSMAKANQLEWLSVVGKKACVGSNTVSKGDQVVITPGGDYDKVTLTLKYSDGNTEEVTLNPGEPLTCTYAGDEKARVSVSATKNGKTASCGFKVYSAIAGVELGSKGATVVLANGDKYGTTEITSIRE